jgi:hypothetical protein
MPLPVQMRGVLRSIVDGARQRARRAWREADADIMAFALDLYQAQGGRCALSGLPFDLRSVGYGQVRRPFAPSLDRIDSRGGYTRDNVRLVCQVVNFALNAYGEDIFREIAVATAGFEPSEVASSDVTERQRKAAYIAHVIQEAPRLLADHGGQLPKAQMRELLRECFSGTLPIDEANSYGWGFRRLTETDVIEPASGSASYTLRSFLR